MAALFINSQFNDARTELSYCFDVVLRANSATISQIERFEADVVASYQDIAAEVDMIDARTLRISSNILDNLDSATYLKNHKKALGIAAELKSVARDYYL